THMQASSLLVGTRTISRQLKTCFSNGTPFSFIRSKLIVDSFLGMTSQLSRSGANGGPVRPYAIGFHRNEWQFFEPPILFRGNRAREPFPCWGLSYSVADSLRKCSTIGG